MKREQIGRKVIRRLFPSFPSKDLLKLIERQFIARQRDSLALILFRVQEGLSPKVTNVTGRNKLQRLAFQGHLETRRKDLAEKFRSRILVQS